MSKSPKVLCHYIQGFLVCQEKSLHFPKNFWETFFWRVVALQGLRYFVFFVFGGMVYVSLELMWRGFSHYSMFLAGGLCFLLLGKLQMLRPQLYLPLRLLLGAVVITSVELLMGLLFNRNYQIWDYRRQFMNFHGQICLKFFCLWIPISLAAMWVYEKMDLLWDNAQSRFLP